MRAGADVGVAFGFAVYGVFDGKIDVRVWLEGMVVNSFHNYLGLERTRP